MLLRNRENVTREADQIRLEEILAANKAPMTVYVLKDQLSQAIGKGGRNVRLASKLAGWEIDIYELGGDTSAPPASASDEASAGGATHARPTPVASATQARNRTPERYAMTATELPKMAHRPTSSRP